MTCGDLLRRQSSVRVQGLGSARTPEELGRSKSQTVRVQLSLFGSNPAANAEEEEVRCSACEGPEQQSSMTWFWLVLGGENHSGIARIEHCLVF